jgi:hypothetical protein
MAKPTFDPDDFAASVGEMMRRAGKDAEKMSESFNQMYSVAKDLSKLTTFFDKLSSDLTEARKESTKIRAEFKMTRDFANEVAKGFKDIGSAQQLYGMIESIAKELGAMPKYMETFQTRSMQARSAVAEINREVKLGIIVDKERMDVLNKAQELFRNTQLSIASDATLNNSMIEGLESQINQRQEDTLKIKKLMVQVDSEYLLQARERWANGSQTLEQLEAQVAEDVKSVAVEEARLKILREREQLESRIEATRTRISGLKPGGRTAKEARGELAALEDQFKVLASAYTATGGGASFYDGGEIKSVSRMLGGVEEERDKSFQRQVAGNIVLSEQKEKQAVKDILNQKQLGGYLQHIDRTQYKTLGTLGGHVMAVKDFMSTAKLVPKPFMLLDLLIKTGYDRFVKLDEAAEKFRRETGFSNTQMVQLRKNAEEVNVELQEFGVNIEDAYAAAGALTEIFGNTALVSKEAMTNVALMSANLGVAAKDSAEVLATFQGLGGASQETAMNVMKVGAGLSEKAGVPFKKVMEDIANASGETLAMLGANPSKLMKSSIAARALGTDMNKLVSAQSKLLDYSTSINSELEASALLGRSVSFQRARQLAYEGDIAGSAKATLETVRKAGDFNKMNMYQRKALAEASGMDLKDLTKMMAVEEQRKKIKLSGTPEEQARLKMQTEALEMLEKENDLSKESLLKSNEAAIRQKKMQGLMTQLKNTFESIMVAVGDVLEPIITSLATVVVPLFKIIAAVLRVTIIPLLKLAAYPLEFIGKLLAKGAETLNEWGNEINKLKEESKGFFAFFNDGIGQWIKMAAGLLGMGLFGFLLFGKSGASGLMSAAGKLWSVINPLNIVKNFKSAGKAVGGFFGKIKEGGIRSLFKKSESIPSSAEAAADKTSTVASKSKDVKSGSGIKDFLTNLADGLKKMGGSGVAKGAFNLLIASPGLITIIPGAVLAGLIPKKAGDNIESFLTGLASGLKAMGTGRITGGAANLLLASVGLVTIIPGALAAVVIGIIGKPIETGLKYLAKGIAYMGDTNVFKGALGIAAVGLSIIPFAFAMQMFSDVDWGAVGIGSLALIGFTAAAFGLGAILSSGVGAAIFGAGVVGIAYLGLALIPFAAAALIAGAGVKMLGEGIASSVDPILRLSEIDLTKAALGIGAIGIALAAFGAGSASAGLGSFVGGLLGGDPIAKMEKLASIGDKLKITAAAISSIAQATSQFTAMDAFSESVTKLATSLGKLNDQISETNILKFSALTAMTSTAAATTATTTQTQTPSGNMAGVEAKLDKLTELLVGGAVRVYLDGKNVSSRVANGYGS